MAEEITAKTRIPRHVCSYCSRYTGVREHLPTDIKDCPGCGAGMTADEAERAKHAFALRIVAIGSEDEGMRAWYDFVARHGRNPTNPEIERYFYHWMELVKSGVRPEYRVDPTILDEAEEETEKEESA